MGSQRAATKSEAAYRTLRRAVVIGEIQAQGPLDDVTLSETYGIGRTPLREALKRMAQEQFLVWEPHRTPYVRDIGLADLRHLYESRRLLEIPIARLAAERVTQVEVEELRRLVVDMKIAYDTGQAYEAVELDHQLHLAIATASRNRFLANAVHDLNEPSLRLWYLGIKRSPPPQDDNHGPIVEAIAERDADNAERLVREHIETSFRRQLVLHGLVSDN